MDKYAHELQAGDSYEPLRFTVTPELNQQFLYAVEDFNPIFIEERDGSPPLVHPVLLMHMSPRTRSPSYRQAPGMGSAFASDSSIYLAPGYVGDTFEVRWRIVNTYPKRGKIYQEYVAEIRDSHGRIVLRRELASTFFSQVKIKPAGDAQL
ncbi:MAG: MaoC family dehydratase [Candidimonas sp.]